MLDDKDVQKIIDANREVFPSKEGFDSFKDEMKQSFFELQTSVDAYTKKSGCLFSGNGGFIA